MTLSSLIRTPALVFLFLLAGCQLLGSPEPKGPPLWIISPPADNAQYYYGVGSGLSLAASKRSAFNDISQKIYTSISSTISSGQTKSLGVTSDSYQERIQSETAKLSFNGSQLIKSEAAGIQFYSLVSVPRANVLADIDQRRSDAIMALDKAANYSASLLDQFVVLNQAAVQQDDAQLFTRIQSGIDAGFDASESMAVIKRFVEKRELNRSIMTVSIKGPSETKLVKQSLQAFFAENGVRFSKGQAALNILLDYKAVHHEVYGTKSSLVSLEIKLTTAKGRIVFDKTIKQAGSSVNDFGAATENAFDKLAKSVVDSGLKQGLGL